MVELQLNTLDNEDTRPAGHPQNTYQEADDKEVEVQLDQLASKISKVWEQNKTDRTRIEQTMMRMQEAVNGEYDASTMSAIKAQGGSEIFIPLTSMQCNAGASWLLSVLTPPGDKAFTFKSTPIPELPQTLKDQIEQQVKGKIKSAAPVAEGTNLPAGPDGSPIQPQDVKKIVDAEEVATLKAFKKESVTRAERMEGLVHDQLLDSGWYKTLEDFVTDLVTLPSAFIKTTYDYKKKMVTTVKDGQFTMEVKEELIAKDERVSAFDIYPSPDQTTIHDGSLIERLKLSRQSIYDCLDKPGYDNESILTTLSDFDSNSTNFTSWQSSVDSTRRYSENHSTDFSGDDGSIYGLRFLGPVKISALLDWGYDKEDLVEQGFLTGDEEDSRLEVKEIDIDAILVGNNVIKVVPNLDPEGKRPYYMASYRKVPGSFWGKSVAMLSTSHQRLVNATARALSNNMGIASGPQIVVYTDRIPNGESIQAIRPLKVWQMTSDPSGSNNSKPIDFFQPESNAQELLAVYQYYSESVGEVTGIPRTSYSSDPSRQSQGAQTASGLAMLLETASKQIKQAVRNIDTGVIEPRLQYQYRTNMMNPEVSNSFKGDMSIDAIGAKSIVAKAVENQRAVELLQATANPMDMEVLGKEGRSALLRTIVSNYDMNDIVPSIEDIEAKEKMQAEQPPQPSPEETKLEIEKMRAEVRIKDQELENQNSEAQRTLDLQIAQMEFEAKQLDLKIAQVQNQENNQAKLQEIALREKNQNARFEYEANLKNVHGTGI